MNNIRRLRLLTNIRSARGYTLLEYCAGAAVIAGVVWAGMEVFGSSLKEFFEALGSWASQRAQDINNTSS